MLEIVSRAQTHSSSIALAQEIEDLKARSNSYEGQGYYQLPGRNEVAFAIYEQLLPCFGFEASKSGLSDMIAQCANHLAAPFSELILEDFGYFG